MAEYDIAFSKSLTEAALLVEARGLDSLHAQRTVLYLSLLAIEIALKAALESAGITVKTIKSRSHELDSLLSDLCHCEILKDIGNGTVHWVSAADVMSLSVHEGNATTSVGRLLSDDIPGKARYPNEIRYGEQLVHYRPETMLKAAIAVCDWSGQYSGRIRTKVGSHNT